MSNDITIESVTEVLGRHVPLYTYKPPAYQTEMLSSLSALWVEHHASVLDIGGGSGIMAEAIAKFLPAGTVTTVDIVDRFLPNLSIQSMTYDGSQLPFVNDTFDAATINNVVHHIPIAERHNIFKEIRRVVNGPLYIKDHLSTGTISNAQLALLDLMGNVPFGGMTKAKYLSANEWGAIAQASGYTIGQQLSGTYRRGVPAAVFPNSLEVSYRFDPAN
ncbi:MAG: SAM-dependent methyltransferase [Hyphomicrobiaceae bacterium]|jgi:SAM-dependent methyltransferase